MSQNNSDSLPLRKQGGAVGGSENISPALETDSKVAGPSAATTEAPCSDDDSLYNFAVDFLKTTNANGEISASLSENNPSGETGGESTEIQETSFSHLEEEDSQAIRTNSKPDDEGEGDEFQRPTSTSSSNDEAAVPSQSGEQAYSENDAQERQDNQIVSVDNGNKVVVQIEDEVQDVVNIAAISPPEPEEPVGPLESYLDLMNNLGFSWYRRVEYAPLSKNRLATVKVIFCIFSMCAILDTFRDIKSEGIEVALDKKMKGCVKFGFVMIRLFNRGCYLYLIIFCVKKISQMLEFLRNISAYHGENSMSKKYSKLAIMLGVGSISITVITVVFYFPSLNEWSVEEAILWRAFWMAKSLLLWSAKEYEYDGVIEYISEEYGEQLTWTSMLLGFVDGILHFCVILQGEIIRDILLLAPLILWHGWNAFDRQIQNQLLVHPNNAEPAELEASLKHYKAMRQANDSTNDTLGTIHKFVTMQNLLLYAYLFVLFITLNTTEMRTIYTIIKIIKVTMSFFASLKIYRKNGNAKKWLSLLSTYKGPVDVEGILGMTAQAALEDLWDNPFGFGTEYFLINETFVMGFVAAVSSIIALLVESEPENKLLFSCISDGGVSMNCTMVKS